MRSIGEIPILDVILDGLHNFRSYGKVGVGGCHRDDSLVNFRPSEIECLGLQRSEID
ncbi:hypothetical protein SDC9_118078 [bioreactor metagenome]|uniref:Uncharacterized protein n=1 Tax=bioreactor metagenome TaxID=1076179 RepID=A0A645C0P9_9ZZZZ